MNHLLRPRIWPSFLTSSGVPSATLRTSSPCDVPLRYASEPIPRHGCQVARFKLLDDRSARTVLKLLPDVENDADVLWEIHPSFRSKFIQPLSSDRLVEILSAMADDDADKVHVRLAKRNTGGSDALCLRTPPPVPG
jgi:hypothetical protein